MCQSTRTILVCESRLRWAPELQRQFHHEPVRVRSCQSLKEISALVTASNSAVEADNRGDRPGRVDAIVVELPEDLSACLQWLASWTNRASVPPIFVIGSDHAGDLEWTLREAGVREVFLGDPSGDRLAGSCRRCWAWAQTW